MKITQQGNNRLTLEESASTITITGKKNLSKHNHSMFNKYDKQKQKGLDRNAVILTKLIFAEKVRML
jgi:hypothetical protein